MEEYLARFLEMENQILSEFCSSQHENPKSLDCPNLKMDYLRQTQRRFLSTRIMKSPVTENLLLHLSLTVMPVLSKLR